MIYDDKAVTAATLSTAEWAGAWPPKTSGPGIIFEGELKLKPTRLMITDAAQQKHRYRVMHFACTDAFERQYDASGRETAIVQSERTKIRTGYLNSSYQDKQLRSDRLTADEARRRLAPMTSKLLAGHTGPNFVFIGPEDEVDAFDLQVGEAYRLKTRGDSPFVETLIAMASGEKRTLTNDAGGMGSATTAVGASWTDKISAAARNEPAAAPGDELEGVDDDEWDD